VGWNVECKDGGDSVKQCMSMEIQGTRRRGYGRKAWWDCLKDDMKSYAVSHKDAENKNEWKVL